MLHNNADIFTTVSFLDKFCFFPGFVFMEGQWKHVKYKKFFKKHGDDYESSGLRYPLLLWDNISLPP